MTAIVGDNRRVRRALLIAAALFASIITFVAGAPVATAHHSEITAQVNCAELVTFTATSWLKDDDHGVNTQVRVWYTRSDEGGAPEHDVTVGRFDGSNGYQFSGSFAWPAAPDATVTVWVQEQVNWGAEQLSGDIGSPRSTAITLPSDCQTPSNPAVTFTPDCVDAIGSVRILLTNSGGTSVELTVVVDGVPQPATVTVPANTGAPGVETVVGSLENNVAHTVAVLDGTNTVGSTTFTPSCAAGVGTGTPAAVCSNNNGTVTITLTHSGGDLPVTFVLDDATTVLNPGDAPVVVTYVDQPDGPFSRTVTINGVEQVVSITVTCDAVLTGTSVCVEVGLDNAPVTYWYTVTNPGTVAVPVTWVDGSATVPAGSSIQISSASPSVAIVNNGATAVTLTASTETCGQTVTFEKKLVGQPLTGETYTIRVSRLVGSAYETYLTFPLEAGIIRDIVLPSTLDGVGITYRIEEIDDGTASLHTVSPDTFTLQGNLGETVSVVVTNAYAAVSIEKTVSATTVKGGDLLTYTLIAQNTGGLTLDPVVISDLLPPDLAMQSAVVAGGGGTCVLTESSRPQTISCDIDGELAPGAFTPTITIVAQVDTDISLDTTILNQAKVVGFYVGAPDPVTGERVSPQTRTAEIAALRAHATPAGELSCLPVADGTVCDLSAKVGTTVERNAESEPPDTVPPTTTPLPVPTTVVVLPPVLTVPPVSQLPVTGSGDLGGTLTLALVLLGLGSLVVLVGRRRSSSPTS